MTPNDNEQYRQRDAASLLMMGSFFLLMGALLLIASTWSYGDERPFTVTLGAGIAIFLVGAGFVGRGRSIKAGGPPDANQRGDT